MSERKLTDIAVRWMRACVLSGSTPGQVAQAYGVNNFIVQSVVERTLRPEVEDILGPIKQCQCGRAFTFAQWVALPDPQVYDFPWGEVHEQRNCPCRSSIVLVLDEGDYTGP